MGKVYFYVSSITNAMRGKSILERSGIRSSINRSTDDKIKNGCGYIIMVFNNGDAAERILSSSGIRIRSIQRIDG